MAARAGAHPGFLTRLRGWAAVAGLALAACGREPQTGSGDEASRATPQAEIPRPAAAAQPERPGADRRDVGPAPRLFPDQLPPVADAVAAEFPRKEASGDDWELEILHERALPVLRAFVAAAAAGDGGALADQLAPDAHGLTDLRPPELEPRFDDGPTRVARPPAGWFAAAELHPPDRAADLARELRAAFVDGEPLRTAVQVVALRALEEGFETRALVELDHGGPTPRQANLEWLLAWSAPADGAPRIRELRTRAYSEVTCERPLLAEVTGAAFGASPRFAQDFLRGVDQHYGRVDRQAGVSYQGMQGIAVGDVDGDGLEDLFVCQQVGVPNALFLRRPDGSFEDVAAAAKVDFLDVTRSALIVDLDNDGHSDLVQAIGASLVVAYNDGGGRFEKQLALPAPGEEQFYSIAAADPDGDGDLDLYACRYALGGVMHGAPTPYADADNGATNHYFRNDGYARFVDATEEAGFAANNRKFSLAAIWEDLDGDGHLDLYVVNDFGRNNLFRNDGTGRFVDVAAQAGVEDLGAGMGATCADFDLDGRVDLYVTNMWSAAGLRIASQPERFMGGRHRELHADYVKHASGNTLLRNLGGGRFEDATAAAGVALGRWAWGAKAIDFQGDGLADLYVPNGQTTNPSGDFDLESFFWRRVISQTPHDASPKEGYKTAFEAIQHLMMFGNLSWNGRERNNAYMNLGGGRFADVSAVSGAGFVDDARCAATLDWDDDGREDLLIKNRTAPALRLMHNRDRSGAAFASFELEGTSCNRDAIGARVVLQAGGRTHLKRVYAGEGYLAQSSRRLLFGLGDARRIERATVEWPGGGSETFEDLAVNARYRIVQGRGEVEPRPARTLGGAHALESAAPPPLPGPAPRVVLAEKLPAEALVLPGFAAPARRVADLAGAPALVLLWTLEHPAGEEALADLAARRQALAAEGLRVVPLAVDEGLALARARKVAEAQGFGAEAGYLDGRTRQALQVLLIEVLGFFRDVTQPTALLLDGQGKVVVLYVGEVDAEQVLADVRTLATMPPHLPTTLKLSGGRFLHPRRRDLDTLAQVYAGLGDEELAGYYGRLAAARKAPR